MEDEVEPLLRQLRADRSFTHLRHVENHWSSLLFLRDRAQQHLARVKATESKRQ